MSLYLPETFFFLLMFIILFAQDESDKENGKTDDNHSSSDEKIWNSLLSLDGPVRTIKDVFNSQRISIN